MFYNLATTTFETATGVAWSDIMDYSGDNIKVIISGGVNFLTSIVTWAIPIAAIVTIVSVLILAFSVSFRGVKIRK